MQLSKSLKIVIGLLTLWTMLFPLCMTGVWLFYAISSAQNPAFASEEIPPSMRPAVVMFFALLCLSIAMIFGLMAFYTVHIVMNREANKVIRILSALGVYFLPYLAMPPYYLVYIWPETPPAWSLDRR